ncbi:MAG: protoporphyrinogen oxidase [Candidatus Polarisedimenticolia bacterium]
MKSVAVVGGGISGLAAAHRLQELSTQRSLPLRAVVLEALARVGGVISTLARDGFLIEEGPDSILTDKPWGRRLAERVGLGAHLIGTREGRRRSFVLRRGRLIPTPEGFYLLAPSRFAPFLSTPLFSLRGKARMALDLVIPRRPPGGDESVGSFVRRRLGREALERIAQPMIAGIYGADPETLSLQATFPRFHMMEAEHGSVIRAMRAAGRESDASGARYGLFASFDQGLESLVRAVTSRLPAGSLRTGAPVTQLRRAADAWDLITAAGSERHDAVVLALPAHASAALIGSLDAELSSRLASIAYADSATVSLAFPLDRVAHPLDGFGFVVPASEGLSITGCTFASRKYAGRAPEGWALLRAFWGPSSAGLATSLILERTLDELRGPLGLRGDPTFAHVSRWPRSMPHYAVGHLDLVADIDRHAARLPRLALAGNAYRGVGIPDCIHSGETAAESLVASLFPVT